MRALRFVSCIPSITQRGLSKQWRRTYAKRITKGVILPLPQGLQNSLPPLSPAQLSSGPQSDVTQEISNVDDLESETSPTKALQYSTVLQGALDNIQAYPHCVLLTRVGGFYELYFNHAEDFHRELGLKRSYRDTKLGPVAMAGFPFFQLDRYLKMLVGEMGRNVAISEEFTREAGPQGRGPIDLNNKNIFDRRVSRVVTPGTLIDEKFMETEESNFLLAIIPGNVHDIDAQFGLAWMDLSTGDFTTHQVNMDSLVSNIQRIQPKEIITSMDRANLPSEYIVTAVSPVKSVSEKWTAIVSSSSETFSYNESLAGTMLLSYLNANLPESEIETLPPTRLQDSSVMSLDSNALYSLEIRRSMRDQGTKGSLLHAMKRTTTKSGARLLSDWLISPITSLPVLEQRLDLVQLLIEDEGLRNEVIRFLKNSGDAVRVLQRFGFGRGEVDDLLTITRAISATADLLIVLLKHEKTASLTDRMTVLDTLRKKIANSIDEVGLMRRNRENAESAAAMMEEVLGAMASPSKPPERRRKAIEREMTYTMMPSASAALRQLHKNLAAMNTEREALQARLCEQTGMQSLTLKTLPGLSHIVHVKGADAKMDMTLTVPEAKNISSTRSTKSHHVPEWSFLGTRIEAAKIQIQQEETRTFQALRREVLRHSLALRKNAQVLDELDVANSFATIAMEHDWVRPTLTSCHETCIVDGRHPVVDMSLLSAGLKFTANDARFTADSCAFLVTGTNMGGKSTFLRQVAIIQVLAQVGSYVPARSAVMGIKDAVFSRLGSSDDLFHGQSTFMLEMKECATILRRATDRSLVLMDEVGRGTTSIDGASIAYASIAALLRRKSSVLFATHFHELADQVYERQIGLLCTDMIKDGDQVWFSHKIRDGVCRDSHGLQVAELAGIPQDVIHDAKVMQKKLLREKKQMTDGTR